MMSDRDSGRLSTYAYPLEVRAGELLIRAPREDDAPIIAPAFRDPAVGGEAGLPPFDEPTLRMFLAERIDQMRRAGLMSPYVIEDAASGRLLGGATLHHLDAMRDVLEVGYFLFVDARGRGVATRAVNALVEHAFANGIYRMEAVVRVGNAVSERVLERAGFTREGVRRRLLRHAGRRVDATLFSRLADE